MKKLLCFVLLSLLTINLSIAQHDHEHNLEVSFPDIPGYVTLATDFHMHTVFSDGSVWPNIRVQEAQREGLDVIAFTDHIEYQPHKDDIPHPDRNRSFNIGLKTAEGSDLIVVNGSEITREMPPGHSNAVFLEDANKLLVDDARAAFEEADRQEAFVFWNHPNWTSHRKDGIARLEDMHLELIEDGLLHGIEVVNMETYSAEALQIALNHNLTIMGTSDIHGLTDWEYNIPHGGHRSITLVFAKERTKESTKEALKNGQTVVWSKDTFIGREEWLLPLLNTSLQVTSARYQGESSVLTLDIANTTHSKFILNNASEYTFHEDSDVIVIEPETTRRILIKTKEKKSNVQVPFKVMNAITAPSTHPVLSFDIEVPD